MKQTEAQFQKVVVRYIRLQYKELLVFAVRNEGKRSVKEQSIIKSMGLTSGVSDLVVLGNNGKVLFLELKSEKGKLTQNQKNFKREVEIRGFRYEVVKNIVS